MARPSPQTDRAVTLMGLLAAEPDASITLAEATRRLGINKSTCHAMLTALTSHAWLLRDPVRKTYRLGPALVSIARVAARSFPALDLAQPAMADFSSEVGANCAALGVGADQVEVLDQVRDLRAVGGGLRVGASIPLRAPFCAAAIAWAEPAAVDRWLSFAPPATHDRYREVLAVIRARGYALEAVPFPVDRIGAILGDDVAASRSEQGVLLPEVLEQIARDLSTQDDYLIGAIDPTRQYSVITISAPVLDADDAVTLLISVWGFATRVTGDEVHRIGQRLSDTTSRLSRSLTGTTPL